LYHAFCGAAAGSSATGKECDDKLDGVGSAPRSKDASLGDEDDPKISERDPPNDGIVGGSRGSAE